LHTYAVMMFCICFDRCFFRRTSMNASQMVFTLLPAVVLLAASNDDGAAEASVSRYMVFVTSSSLVTNQHFIQRTGSLLVMYRSCDRTRSICSIFFNCCTKSSMHSKNWLGA
jgi:hypothetical protein